MNAHTDSRKVSGAVIYSNLYLRAFKNQSETTLLGGPIFFLLPATGLTNRPPVRDSDPGPPLLCYNTQSFRKSHPLGQLPELLMQRS